jgi:hypothetical protein
MGYARSHFSAATAAVANRFITATTLKRGTYGAVANSGTMPTEGARHVTITLTRNDAVDNPLGTITIAGTDLSGKVVSEVMTPLDNTIATSSALFKTVTAVTGDDTWVTAGGADGIVVGCDAAAVVATGAGVLHGLVSNTAAAGAVTLADAGGTIAVIPSNQAAGTYYEFDANWSGYLSVTAAAATDITLLHTGSQPTSYAMS